MGGQIDGVQWMVHETATYAIQFVTDLDSELVKLVCRAHTAAQQDGRTAVCAGGNQHEIGLNQFACGCQDSSTTSVGHDDAIDENLRAYLQVWPITRLLEIGERTAHTATVASGVCG